MEILFTRNRLPLSRLIRYVTKEPVSHCAILEDGWVFHATMHGVVVEKLELFTSVQEIVFTTSVGRELTWRDVVQFIDAGYDYGALLYLGLRAIIPMLPKANLWQTSGLFICTEFVTEFLEGEENHLITPYQLYKRLSENSK